MALNVTDSFGREYPLNNDDFKNQALNSKMNPAQSWNTDEVKEDLSGISKEAQIISKFLKSIDINIKKLQVSSKDTTQAIEDAVKGKGSGGNMGGSNAGNWFNKLKTPAAIAGVSQAINDMLGGQTQFNRAFAGALKDEQDFRIGMREIAFQTEGITGDAFDMQKHFTDIGKVVATTGKSLSMFQQVLVMNLKKGVQSREDEIALTKTSLNLSTMIGSDAVQTAETFHQWHMTLGLSNVQMDEISRGIQNVAMQSGITGDNLLNVVKNSEKFVRSMRNAGTLTAQSAKNIIGMQAAAEKMGVSEEMAPLMEAMSNSGNLFLQASEQTKALLFNLAAQAGRISELQAGTLPQNKAGMKDMAAAMADMAGRFIPGGFEGMKNASSQQLMQANLTMQSVFGIQIGEAKKMYDAMTLASKSIGEQIQDIDREMKTQVLTEQEITALKKKQQNLEMSAGFEFMTSVDEAVKSGKSLQDAAVDAANKLGPETMRDLSGLGVKKGQELQGAGMLIAKNLHALGGKDLTGEISAAIASGNKNEFRKAMADLTEEQKKIGIKAATSVDPLTTIAQQVTEINEKLRGFTGPFLAMFTHVLGPGGLITLYLASMLGKTGAFTGVFTKGTGLIGRGLKRFFMPKNVANMTEGAERGTSMAGGVAGDAGMGGMASGGEGLLGSLSKVPNMSQLKGVAKNIIIGAAVMAILAPALVGLGTWIIWISKKIFGLAGIDAGEAQKLGWQIAGFLLATAAIYGAVLLTTAELVGTGLAISVLEEAGPEVWGIALVALAAGAATMAILTPAIVGLAVAVLWMCKKIMALGGVDAGQSFAVAKDVATLTVAAGAIVGAVLLSAGALMGLGALTIVGGLLFPLMITGAKTLQILIPAMVMMAEAVILFTDEIMKSGNIDVKNAAKVSGDIADLMWSAAKIVGAVAIASIALMAIGAGVISGLGLIAGPLMIIGAEALAVLVPGVVAMSEAVVYLADETIKGIGIKPEEASKVAESVATLIESASKITGSVIKMSKKLVTVGAVSAIAGSIIAPLMIMGAEALGLITPAIILFSAGLIKLSKGVMDMTHTDADTASKVASEISTLITSADLICNSVLDMSKKFLMVGGIALLLAATGPFGYIAVGAALSAGAVALAGLTVGVSAFAIAIGEMAEGVTKAIDVGAAADAAQALGSLITSSVTMATQISKLSKITFSSAVGGIYDWVRTNIFDKDPPKPEDWKSTTDSIITFVNAFVEMGNNIRNALTPKGGDPTKAIGDVADTLSQVSGFVGICMDLLETTTSKFDKLTSRTWSLRGLHHSPFGQMKKHMKEVVDFLKDEKGGLAGFSTIAIGPITTATTSLNIVADALEALSAVIDKLSEIYDKMGNIDVGKLGALVAQLVPIMAPLISAAHPNTVGSRIAQENATTNPVAANVAQATDVAGQQLTELQEINTHLIKIEGFLAPSKANPSTRTSNNAPLTAPDYGSWPNLIVSGASKDAGVGV